MKKKGLGSPAYELGIHIKKYREQKNWSQDDLASKIETDQKRISKIETGNVYGRGKDCAYFQKGNAGKEHR